MSVLHVTTATWNSTSFNGGLTQIGLNFMGQSGSGDFPFIDAVKMIQGWSYNDNSNQPLPDELDANGWPVSGTGVWESKGGLKGVAYTPTQAQRAGNYVCRWTGSGTIIAGPGTTVSGSKVGSGGSNTFIFTPTSLPLVLGVTSGTITDLTVVHEDDAVDFDNGAIFNTKFLDTLRYTGAGCVRFLDWMGFNRSVVTNWAARKPVSYFSYASAEYRSNIYAGVTGGTGDNYVITTLPVAYQYGDTGSYIDKQYAMVRFDRSATTTTVTLKLGSGPTKSVMRYTTDALTSNSRPVVGTTALMVYDATLDVWLKSGGDINDGQYPLQNGIPPEICLALCEELGAHPWFCLPYLAADPFSNWSSSLATYIRDNMPSWMVPRFEGVNELWHFSNTTGFPGTSYASAKNNVRNAVSAGAKTISGCTFDFSGGVGVLGTSTITFAAPHPFVVGATIVTNGFTGTNIFGYNGQTSWVTSVLSSTMIVINRAPTSGTAVWSSGGTVTGVASDNKGWYGRTIAQLGEIVSGVYGGDRNRYAIICGVQTQGTTAGQDECLKSTQYFIESGRHAYAWVTHIATAQYWNPQYQNTHTEVGQAFDYFITYAANPSQQDVTMLAYLGHGGLPALGTIYQDWYTWANGFGPSIGMMGYEGGFSPDYTTSLTTSTITNAVVDDGTHVTLTLATSSLWGTSIAGNPAVVGIYLKITAVVGMTQLNNNTYPVSGVAGNSVTILIPSTAGFGAYTSGGSAEYFANNAGLSMTSLANTLRYNAKIYSVMETMTETNLNNFATANGEFPSQFLLSARTTISAGYVVGATSQVWAVYDPDIYATPSPALIAIKNYVG